MTPLLSVRRLTVQAAGLDVPELDFYPASHTVIIGANGAGKSTLLSALAGRNPAVRAEKALTEMTPAQLAAKRAVFAQQQRIAFALPVKELAALGREPYRGMGAASHDAAVLDYCLTAFDVAHLAGRNSQTLSGGEQHRAQLARVLAQIMPDTQADLTGKWLLLDEPTNHLDIAHIHRLMQTVRELTSRGLCVISVLHDPALALNCADRLLLLQQGRITADLTPAALAENPALLGALYGVNAVIHEAHGRYFLHCS